MMTQFIKQVHGDLTIIQVVGTPYADELLNVLQELYNDRPTRNMLWDLTQSSAVNLNQQSMRAMADCARGSIHTRDGGKTALVATAELEFGLCRMLDILLELYELPVHVRSFRTLSDAAAWLAAPTADLPHEA